MPLDFDVERVTPPMSSYKYKAHGKKRSLSDPSLAMPIRLPPWYVRIFLYSMMILCFCMVLFWTPGGVSDKNAYMAAYHADRAAVYKDPEIKVAQEKSEEAAEATAAANLINWKDIVDLEDAKAKCDKKKFEEAEFTVCYDITIAHSPAHTASIKELQYDTAIAKILKSGLEKHKEAGLFQINPSAGPYAMQILQSGRKVFATEMFTLTVPCLKLSATKNGHLDNFVLVNNAISDNVGDFAIDDPIRAKKAAAVRSVRLQDILKFVPFVETILMVTMQSTECSALGSTSLLFKKLKIHEIVVVWGTGYQISPTCLENLLNNLEPQGLLPFNLQGSPIDLRAAIKSGWNGESIHWKKH